MHYHKSKGKSVMNIANRLSVKYVYLVRNVASYQSFIGSLYGLVWFNNKYMLIKVRSTKS